MKYILLITLICFGLVGCNTKSGCQCNIPNCTCEISQLAKDMCNCQDTASKIELPEIPKDGSRPNKTLEN